MRNILKITLVVLTTLLLANCNKSSTNTSRLTGLKFNDPKNGNYIRSNSFKGQKPPPGMVAIEGGSFTMGQVQDDVMFDWNTTPRQLHVRSFYMDDKRPFGVNNKVFKDVGMPHVLQDLQGVSSLDEQGNVAPAMGGSLTAEEYDVVVRDLTNFLEYVGEPSKLERESMGYKVLIFLFIFFIIFTSCSSFSA